MSLATSKKKLLFLTGTRADFGKLKPLMQAVDRSVAYECLVFVTGMHTLSRYGYTVEEVRKAGFQDIYVFMNQFHNEPMELILSNTIGGLSRYVHESENVPDMIIVHGDRIETLAGAIVGTLRNILVAHVEGGEISGTVDELIRHAVSKLSHIHFVANDEASARLGQMGEAPDSIFVIGSPDIEVMLSSDLPDLESVTSYYQIPFEAYGLVLFHPVTTEVTQTLTQAESLVSALIESGQNYVVIYPNNDEGSNAIFQAYHRLTDSAKFRIIPSLRFEAFLSLLKHTRFVIGNSSVGIREAPVYGVPSINIGTRQLNRFRHTSIHDVSYNKAAILEKIQELVATRSAYEPNLYFGKSNSLESFMETLAQEKLWQTSKQKQFFDLPSAFSLKPSQN